MGSGGPAKAEAPNPFAYLEPDLGRLTSNGTAVTLTNGDLTIDLTSATFDLEVKDFENDKQRFSGKLYKSYAAGWKELKNKQAMLPVNAVDAYGKEVFDSVLAGISLMEAQDKTTSKQKLLSRLRKLLEQDKAKLPEKTYTMLSQFLDDAIKLKDYPDKMDKPGKMLRGFLNDPIRSTPIGFWTWSPALKKIFIQDRFLQTKFPEKMQDGTFPAEPLRSYLNKYPDLMTAYKFHKDLEETLNNPFSYNSLLAPNPKIEKWGFLPAVRSNEGDLQKEMAKNPNAPKDPMDEIIQRLKDGRLAFNIKPDSGYYDYQQHALEAIVLAYKNPEANKVRFGPKYLQRLEEAFKTGMAKARESHIKSLEVFPVMSCVSMPTPPDYYVSPFLPVEPLPTAYMRYAEGFDFLLKKLPQILGSRKAYTYHPNGKPRPIYARLKEARDICYGMSLLSAQELGMLSKVENQTFSTPAGKGLSAAKNWLKKAKDIKELDRDTRFIVPISADDESITPRMIHCWASVGVQIVKVEASFIEEPKLPNTVIARFLPRTYYLVTDKFMALDVPYAKGPVTREQFRKVLDEAKTLEEAVNRLRKGEY